jgi:PAS domain S-box-containing protein
MENRPSSSNVDFAALFRSLPGLYLVLAPDLTIVAASDAYIAATRISRDRLLGRNLFDVFPDHPHATTGGTQNLRASLGRVFHHGIADQMPVQRYDLPLPPSEGGGFEEKHWSLLNSPLIDSDGRVTHIVHRVQDVSDLVRLRAVQIEKDREAVLQRQTEAKLRELADAMPQIVWAARPDGTIDYFNRRWHEFTGLPPTENLPAKDSIDRILHPDDIARCNEAWRRSLQTGEPYEIEYRFRDRHTDTGGYRWFLGRALPVRDDEGEIIRWYGTCTDISDQKLSEMELTRAKESAEAANKAKDQFLAVLSHELRTPLTPVLLTVSLLESARELPQALQEDIQTIRRHVELEARLIDDLLDLTRITRGKMQLKFESVDIHPLIRRTIEKCCSMRAADLTVALDARRHHVRGDPTRLAQIFWNLFSNADKFTPTGNRITIRSSNNDGVGANGVLRIEVADDGVGIDPMVLPVIFNAFQQGDASLTRRFGGLGLGLTITKALVEAHDGLLTAKSPGRGQGSQFIVELPTVPASPVGRFAAAAASDSPSPPLHVTAPAGTPLKILLVEDHGGTLEIMTRLLRALGHHVKTAVSVKDALAAAEGEEIDLVISDLALPDGSGHDVMRALKSRYKLKGIAVSGFGMDEDINKSLEAGFLQHLTKPIDLERLREAIQQVADGEKR